MSVRQQFVEAVLSRDLDALTSLLSRDVHVFSPTLFRPFEGRDTARLVLGAVLEVIKEMRYVGELAGETTEPEADSDTVHGLLFRGRAGDREIHGIDLLQCDDDGRISTLTIMVRPLSGLTALKDAMTAALATPSGGTR